MDASDPGATHAYYYTTDAFPFTAKAGGGIGFDVGIYSITALLSLLGPVRDVSGIVQTRNPERPDYSLDHFGESFQVECENLMAGLLQFERGAVGTILFDSNSIFVLPEKPSLVVAGTQGVMYMADPNLFGGEVRVMLKGNSDPFVMQQSHAFNSECRGLGVADMAWALRTGRQHRASKEMAYHALEVLHGIVASSATRSNQAMTSTFERTPAIPRGHTGLGYFHFMDESGLAG